MCLVDVRFKFTPLQKRFETVRGCTNEDPLHHFDSLNLLNTFITTVQYKSSNLEVQTIHELFLTSLSREKQSPSFTHFQQFQTRLLQKAIDQCYDNHKQKSSSNKLRNGTVIFHCSHCSNMSQYFEPIIVQQCIH